MTRVTAEDLACLDGTIMPVADAMIPVTDDGLVRGDGAFEVMRVYAGTPFALREHLDRLERSVGNLRLSSKPERAVLEQEVAELLEERGGSSFDGALRIMLTNGGRRILMTEPLAEMAERVRLTFVTYSPTRILDGVKSLSYAANMLASRVAQERGYDEALLVTPHGRVLEAPTSSLFWVDERGELCTPPLDDHILESITRSLVIRATEAIERPVTADELLGAREAFLASTIREVQSVATIDERSFPQTGERTLAAAGALRALIERELGAQ